MLQKTDGISVNNLSEIIHVNDDLHTIGIEYSVLKPYAKMLNIYYKDAFCSDEPILLVLSVTNNSAYCKIVPASEITEAICAYLEVDYIDENVDDNGNYSDDYTAMETMLFNSRPLDDMNF